MGTIDTHALRRILCSVEKPGRYAGGEMNAVCKPSAVVRMAISYPDLYEVGMSNHGIRILYDRVNRVEEYACERVFAAAPDFEEALRREGIPLFTLESRLPLHELDLVGFNLSHELVYTNVLQILDLGGVPLLRVERGDDMPIVVAGGEAASNPGPMGDFIDVFFLGDGEEGIVEKLDVIAGGRRRGLSRSAIIEALASVPGVLLPGGKGAARRVYRSAAPWSVERPVIPSMRVTQEKAVVEVTRGCFNLCKFCHAGYYDLPCRSYDDELLADAVIRAVENTGYSELTLSSLSISDYRGLVPLLNRVFPWLTRNGVSLSLPSLRVDASTIPIIEFTSDVRKSSLTFAVESGSDAMRARAHKRLDESDLLEIAAFAAGRGWRHLKLYFMIGLPGCDEHDEAESIRSIIMKILAAGGKKLELNITVSPFIPKPHTPFQRERQMSMEYFDETVKALKRSLPRRVAVKNHDVRASTLEGVMSRGDEKLGRAILRAYLDGCRLDSWGEHFRYDLWIAALDAETPHWREYLDRRGPDEPLPWQRVSTGREKLVGLMERSRAGRRPRHPKRGEELDTAAIEQAYGDFTLKYEVAARARLVFSKKGELRYVSHNDFVEVIRRALRMADVPVAYTQGFNKRERLAFGFPLPLGLESEAEICDADLYGDLDAESAIEAVSSKLPGGSNLMRARVLGDGETASVMSAVRAVAYRIGADSAGALDSLHRFLNERRPFSKKTKSGVREIEFDRVVLDAAFDTDAALLTVSAGNESSVRIDEILSVPAGGDMPLCVYSVVKTAQFALDGGGLREIL